MSLTRVSTALAKSGRANESLRTSGLRLTLQRILSLSLRFRPAGLGGRCDFSSRRSPHLALRFLRGLCGLLLRLGPSGLLSGNNPHPSCRTHYAPLPGSGIRTSGTSSTQNPRQSGFKRLDLVLDRSRMPQLFG